MTARVLAAWAACSASLLGAPNPSPSLVIRGKPQSVSFISSSPAPLSAAQPHDRAVLLLPGDGGWRGLAITIGEEVSRWNYDVYGFDTKQYLESFTESKKTLSESEMRADMHAIVEWIRARGAKSVTILGWSQGAGMAVLAAGEDAGRPDGVVTLGLPESAVLGWNWKDTLAVIAHREPDEPHVAMKSYLADVTPVPIWMIHGTLDEFTTPEAARTLFSLASEPKRLVEIEGGNHHFDGKRDRLYQALREGLDWVRTKQ
ncbi:MAG: alpha/beta fold hydrolase [Acidobacteriota bacterium]